MKSINILLSASLLFTACQTEKINICKTNVYHLPAYLGFVNYNLVDIDTVVREMYEKGSNFSILLQTDTLVVSQPISKSDTITIERSTEIAISNENDYKIIIPAVNKTHIIKDVVLGDTVVTNTTKGECSRGHAETIIRPALSYNLDGNVVTPYKESVNHFIVFCKK